MLARTRKWVESWDRVKDRPEDELKAYVLGKCRNGFQVAKKPSRNQRDAWVTLLAEPGKTKDQLSPLALRVVEHVKRRLEEDGYDVEVNLDETGGVAYAEVHFKTLTKKTPPRSLAGLIVLVCALSAGACGPRLLIAPHAPVATLPNPATAVSRAVIVVSIDGLRPDAIAAFGATTLGRLVAEGSSTLTATTILPSSTLPSHTSMLTGQSPDRHHVSWNTAITHGSTTVAVPTVFSEARSRGYTTAAFFSKAKFSALQREGTLDYSQAPGGWFGRWPAAKTVSDVEAYLGGRAPNLLFVHLSDPDKAGHASGWMSEEYGRAVRRADAGVARLLTAADRAYGAGLYTMIVTADHGGHGRGHGSDDPRDVTIPWIAWGRGVVSGPLQDPDINTVDTAATVLYLLGIDRPSGWGGTAVTAAFVQTGGSRERNISR